MLIMIKESIETPIGTYLEKKRAEEYWRSKTELGYNYEEKIAYDAGYKKAIDDIMEAIERS